MKRSRTWVSVVAGLGVAGAIAGAALLRISNPESRELISGEKTPPVASTPVAARPQTSAPSPDPASASSAETRPQEQASPISQSGPEAAGAPVTTPADHGRSSAEAILEEVEQSYRSPARAVRMDIVTERVQSEPIQGIPPYEEVGLWGMVGGAPGKTSSLYVFFTPSRFQGTGLLIEDSPDSREGDSMWYHMRSFRRFQQIPETSLRFLVAGTCMTYEDARGFLATDRYAFQLAEPGDRKPGGQITIQGRPLTPELESNTGYKAVEVRVDTARHFVSEIRFTGLNGQLVKVYTASDPVQVGGSWLPGTALIDDLQNSVKSTIRYKYWPVRAPQEGLFETTVEDQPLLDRLVGALGREGIETGSPAPPS